MKYGVDLSFFHVLNRLLYIMNKKKILPKAEVMMPIGISAWANIERAITSTQIKKIPPTNALPKMSFKLVTPITWRTM